MLVLGQDARSGAEVKPLHTQEGSGADTSTSPYEKIMMMAGIRTKTVKHFFVMLCIVFIVLVSLRWLLPGIDSGIQVLSSRWSSVH